MWDGTYRFTESYVLFSEGAADKTFFQKLAESRRLPRFDAPWPTDGDEGAAPKEATSLYGRDKFWKMLQTLRNYLIGVPRLKEQLKLVIIATDATSDWKEGFRFAIRQIQKAKGFAIPDQPLQIKNANSELPIAILLVPGDGRSGGLETLYADALCKQNDAVCECMDTFLDCCPTKPGKWPAEKFGKARFQCLIASTHKKNPSMPAAWALSSRDGPPVVDINQDCFNSLGEDLEALCVAAGVK